MCDISHSTPHRPALTAAHSKPTYFKERAAHADMAAFWDTLAHVGDVLPAGYTRRPHIAQIDNKLPT